MVLDIADSRAHINYSENMLSALPRLWEEVRRVGSHLDFEILSISSDIETLRLHTQYWRDLYRSRGYSELVPIGRKSLRYEVKCLVDGDYSTAEVVLISARGERKVVGKFKTVDEGREFIEMYYAGDNPYRLPVYSTNSLTKEFLFKIGTSILKI